MLGANVAITTLADFSLGEDNNVLCSLIEAIEHFYLLWVRAYLLLAGDSSSFIMITPSYQA